jgi:hypothetical protein
MLRALGARRLLSKHSKGVLGQAMHRATLDFQYFLEFIDQNLKCCKLDEVRLAK